MLTETDKCVLNEVPRPNRFGHSHGVRSLEHGIALAIRDHVMEWDCAGRYAVEHLGATTRGMNHWLNHLQGTEGLVFYRTETMKRLNQ